MKNSQTSLYQITRLGHQGDGLAESPEGTVAIPFTLPGETVKAKRLPKQKNQAECLEIVEKSPHRVQPPCPYFGKCGGCRLQHLDELSYSSFKKQQVEKNLEYQGLDDSVVEEPILLPPHSRRRVSFKVIRTSSGISLGYYKLHSHHIVDIESCAVVVPEIEALIDPLKNFLSAYLKSGEKLEVKVTLADQGLDVRLQFSNPLQLSMNQRVELTEFAKEQNLCRLTCADPKHDELIICLQEPTVSFAGVPVSIDAGGFLQASQQADDLLSQLVLKSVEGRAKKIADLFCGRGTLTFALSTIGRVDGFEQDEQALEAMEKAARSQNKSIRLFERDLFTDPLLPKELEFYDVLVLDPPRAGALKQVEQISKSKIATLVMISCNPATFARDACLLKQGGYSLQSVTPVDQFKWSHHIEVVALFKLSP